MKSSQMRQPRRHISPALGTAVAVWGGRGGHGPEQPHPRVPSPSPNCPIFPHPHVPSVPMPPPTSTPQPSMSPTSPLIPMFPHNPLWTHCPPPYTPLPPPYIPLSPPPCCHSPGLPAPVATPAQFGGVLGPGGLIGGPGGGLLPATPHLLQAPQLPFPPRVHEDGVQPHGAVHQTRAGQEGQRCLGGGWGVSRGGGGDGVPGPPQGVGWACSLKTPSKMRAQNAKRPQNVDIHPPPTPRIWGAPKTWRLHPKMWGSHS